MNVRKTQKNPRKKSGPLPFLAALALLASGGAGADMALNDGKVCAVVKSTLEEFIQAPSQQASHSQTPEAVEKTQAALLSQPVSPAGAPVHSVSASSGQGSAVSSDKNGSEQNGSASVADQQKENVAALPAAPADAARPDAASQESGLQGEGTQTGRQPAGSAVSTSDQDLSPQSGSLPVQSPAASQKPASLSPNEFSAPIVHAPRPREKDPEEMRNERIQSTIDDITKQNVAGNVNSPSGTAEAEAGPGHSVSTRQVEAEAAASGHRPDGGKTPSRRISSASSESENSSGPKERHFSAPAHEQGSMNAGRAAWGGKIMHNAAPDGTGPETSSETGASFEYNDRIHMAQAPLEKREDPVVTGAYLQEAAKWMVSSYIPPKSGQGTGRTSLTLNRINIRSGETSTLRSESRDPNKKRLSILKHVLSPGMLSALTVLYSDRIISEMDGAAGQYRQSLTPGQRDDMFAVYGKWLMKISSSLNAASGVDIASYAGEIQSQARHEAQANREFSKAYNARANALFSGKKDEASSYNYKMKESSMRAGYHASLLESKRTELARDIARRAEGETLSLSELTYLGEWLARRNASPETVHAAAEACERLAQKFFDRARNGSPQ